MAKKTDTTLCTEFDTPCFVEKIEETSTSCFGDYVRFGFGFYIGFNLARLCKRLIKAVM